MPSSRPNTIPTVIHVIRQLSPASILDVGVGFGKWGHLFREYTDIIESETNSTRYDKENWRVRIDGIEGHEKYVTEMHKYLYDHIHIGDASDLLHELGSYDVIFLGDIIEHFEKARGEALLRVAMERVDKAVIVSTPKYETGQGASCDNELERHRSLWRPEDFRGLGNATIRVIDRETILAVIIKPGVPRPNCYPQVSRGPWKRMRQLIRKVMIAAIGESRWNRLRGRS